MKTAVWSLVVFVFPLLCPPADAGQIVRSGAGTREAVTIVDHGHTRGRPAVRLPANSRTAAPKHRARAMESEALAAAEANVDREPLATDESAVALDVMATQVVTSVLEFRLLTSEDANVPDIGTDPTARGLRLLGAVPDDAARSALALRAMEIAGTDTVRNELQVLSDWEPTAYLVFDDEHVQERVARALLGWPELHAADIQVAVDQGITTLTGTVATADHRVLASTVAASEPGVYLVQNRLGLLPEEGEIEPAPPAVFYP